MFGVQLLDTLSYVWTEISWIYACYEIWLYLCWIDFWNMVHLRFGLKIFLEVLLSWNKCSWLQFWTPRKTIFHEGLNMFSWWCWTPRETIYHEGWTCFRGGVSLSWKLYFMMVQPFFCGDVSLSQNTIFLWVLRLSRINFITVTPTKYRHKKLPANLTTM